ncbi:MAG TPA: DUF1735 domain-containing protein [Puia sp.]|nr:DUF1735 domain-containing protein [Puia sp.]
MRYITIKNFCAVAALISLGGCLKKNEMNIDPETASSVVTLSPTGSNKATTASSYQRYYSDFGVVKVGDHASFNLNVEYSGGETAQSDITVNIALDTAALSKYNKQDELEYEVPPVSTIHMPSSVVIKKGTQLSQNKITIDINGDYDFGAAYALPIKITSVSSGIISTNLGTSIYSFGVRNDYDGHYSMKGYSVRAGDPVKTGNFTNDDGINLLTGGLKIVQFEDLQVWADLTGVGIDYPVLTVNSDNTVTIVSAGGATNAPGYPSRYDPATKTFYISFTWGTGGPTSRLATDTLVYIKAR